MAVAQGWAADMLIVALIYHHITGPAWPPRFARVDEKGPALHGTTGDPPRGTAISTQGCPGTFLYCCAALSSAGILLAQAHPCCLESSKALLTWELVMQGTPETQIFCAPLAEQLW